MRKIFKRGLIAIAPLGISIAIIYWLFSFLEEIVGTPLKDFIGTKYYYPGMGILAAAIILFLVGAILNTWLISKVTHFFERTLKKIPLFNSLYKMLKNVTHFFQSSPGDEKKQVVEVTIAGIQLVGFITREDFSEFPAMESDRIAVYLPMSYQIGGYTLILPRDKVKPIDLSIEEALQYSLIAWAHKPPE